MTCSYYGENNVRCGLSQFFYDHTEQGLSYPGLPFIHSFLKVINLSWHCGVANQHDQCEGSKFEIEALEVSADSKEQFRIYQEKMKAKWSKPAPAPDTI